MNMEEMIRLFLDSRKRGVSGARKRSSPATVDFYRKHLRIFADYLVTETEDSVTRYESVRRMHIVGYLDWLDAKKDTKVWSQATVLQNLRTLRAFFRWVDKDEDCQLHELKGLQKYLPAIPRTPRRADIPDSSEMKKFRDLYNTHNRWEYRDYVAVSLLMTNGIRIGELCGIKMDHIQLDNKLVVVTGKTGTRVVPITNEMVRLIKGWMKRRGGCKTAEGSDFLFVGKYRGQMTEEGFAHRFSKHGKRHGLPRITAHTFRHGFCTNYLRRGGDIEKLRNITGHTSYEMLKEYLHLAKFGTKEAQDELEKVNFLK